MTVLIIVLSIVSIILACISAYFGSKSYALHIKIQEVIKACEETDKRLQNLKKQSDQEAQHLLDVQNQCIEAQTNLDSLKQEQGFYLSKYEQSKELYQQQQSALEQINSTLEQTKKTCEIAEQETRNRLLIERKQWEEDRNKEYLLTQQDLEKSLVDLLAQITQKSQELNTISKNVDAAIELNKQAYNESQNKWQLLIDKTQLMQYNKLKDIANEFDDKELRLIIGKIAWTYIWKNSYTQLVKRQFDDKQPCGIYKITNLTNNMCYIGQSVNVPRRWSEHIKCALGADAKINIHNYPLYTAMYKDGLENFKFELIAEYKNTELDEREKFWQDFYHAKDFGYCKK